MLRTKRSRLLVVIALIFTAAYAYLYQIAPLPEPWNEFGLNLIIALAAASAAWSMTQVYRQFDPDEAVRQIWRYFAWGLWAWTLAEVVWGGYAVFLGEMPLISLTDFFWAIGYIWLAAALYQQYLIVHRQQASRGWRLLLWGAGAVLVVTTVLTIVVIRLWGAEEGWLAVWLNVFYPLGDLVIAVAAWRVTRLFWGGRWARPWLGLFGFVVADTVYTLLIVTGIYSFDGNLPSLLADVVYVNAYFFMALMISGHLELLQQGPPPS